MNLIKNKMAMENEMTCRRIADYIISHHNKRDQSLLYGNTGVSLVFYKLGTLLKESKYIEYADSLLDEIYGSLSRNADVSFASGMAGVGWGLSYMVHHKYVEGDVDSILSDIDERIYLEYTSKTHKDHISFYNGIIGNLLYLGERLKNGKKDLSVYRINLELFKYQINIVDKLVVECYPSVVNDHIFDLFRNFPVLFSLLADSIGEDLFKDKIINMVTQWVSFIISYVPGLHSNRISLALSLAKLNIHLQNGELERHIQLLLSSIDWGRMRKEFFSNRCWLQNGSVGVSYVLTELIKFESCLGGVIPIKEIQNSLSEIFQAFLSELGSLQMEEIGDSISTGLATGFAGSMLLFFDK